MSQTLDVSIRISSDEYLRLYQGAVRTVLAYDREGRKVRFSAHILRPFVTREGINGVFRIHFDDNQRFRHIERLA